MREWAKVAFLASSTAFQFGMALALAQADGFVGALMVMSLTILISGSVALGILLERLGLA